MGEPLKVGTRVHVLKQHHRPHRHGGKGTVTVGPYRLGDWSYYVVAMNGDMRGAPAVFAEDEIEAVEGP